MLNLFRKGFAMQNDVTYEVGGSRIFLEVNGVGLILTVENNYTFLHCTCKHCSVYHDEYLCSYKIAVILYLSTHRVEIPTE